MGRIHEGLPQPEDEQDVRALFAVVNDYNINGIFDSRRDAETFIKESKEGCVSEIKIHRNHIAVEDDMVFTNKDMQELSHAS